MDLESHRRIGKKFQSMLRTYFYVYWGNPNYPRFVQLISSQLWEKNNNDPVKVFNELKSILDQRFAEMNKKNNSLLSLVESSYASAGVAVADETYEYVIQLLVFYDDFNLDATWKHIKSELDELGHLRFNQQCIHIFNMVDKITDDMIRDMQ